MEDADEPLEAGFDEPLDEEATEDAEPADPDAAATDEDADVESIEDLIAKKDGARPAEEDEDPLLAMGREERLEPLAVKVVPPQPTEFVCKKCYLVKHQSQLKDKKRTLCRDCA